MASQRHSRSPLGHRTAEGSVSRCQLPPTLRRQALPGHTGLWFIQRCCSLLRIKHGRTFACGCTATLAPPCDHARVCLGRRSDRTRSNRRRACDGAERALSPSRSRRGHHAQRWTPREGGRRWGFRHRGQEQLASRSRAACRWHQRAAWRARKSLRRPRLLGDRAAERTDREDLDEVLPGGGGWTDNGVLEPAEPRALR